MASPWLDSARDALGSLKLNLALTGALIIGASVAVRREFESRLQQQLHERRRSETGSALFIDLDGFKAVNDMAGHAAGDAILIDVAGQIRAMVAAHKLQWQDLALGVTTSIGVAEIDDSLDDMAAVLAAADAACYEAKRAGRNVVRVWRGVSPMPG